MKVQKQKRHRIIVFLILLAVLAGGYLAYNSQFKESYSLINEQQIQQKFNCSRMTDDVLETDIYCQFPNLYNNGTITEAELNKGLGCDRKDEIENKDHPCINPIKYTEYKEWLLKQDKKLKTEDCVNTCTIDKR